MHMAYSKTQRQNVIADLIRMRSIASQEELAQLLSERGVAASQATISRDLEQIGAVKVRRAGRPAYAIVGQPTPTASFEIERVVREWVLTIETAQNMIVIKTPPGSAHLIGVALDRSELEEIVGTICGDDTIFVACRGSSDAKVLARKLSSVPPRRD